MIEHRYNRSRHTAYGISSVYFWIHKQTITSPLGDVGLWGEFEGGWKISISLARRRFLLEKRLHVVSEFFRLSAYLTAIINRKIELGVRVRVSQLRLYRYEYAVPQFQCPRRPVHSAS
jgi:hypothetical protein